MIHINLRDFYPEYYQNDYFIEVPDEVAEVLILLRRYEQAYRRRMYDHKAQYSLDAFETTEREALAHSPSAEEVYDRYSDHGRLLAALMTLTESQRNRVYEHFFLNKTYKEIADAEGVDISAVRRSIHRALRQLRKKY